MRTRHLSLVTSTHSVTTTVRSNVLSPYGPVRAGLITMQRTKEDQALTELLNSLERKIVELSIKSCEVLNIFLSDTEHLAKQKTSFSNTGITDSI